ncbi:MAG: YqaA family protein [bacterium]|nr:YqaA family protein [bacterium]
MIKELITWTAHWAETAYGPIALFILAFAESSFFPIPPDILLIALGVLNPPGALFFSAIATAGSVLGGMFGYLIGIKGGRPILEWLVAKDKIVLVHSYFEKYEAWAIFIAGFTPIPYKVFTIAAGAFYINFKRFVIASLLGRGGRFFLVGGLITFFGEDMKVFMERHLDVLSILFVVLLILGVYALRHLPVFKKTKE